jgi:outer membrane protein assembly factor BamB
MMLAALLVAFSFSPVSHGPRLTPPVAGDKPFFVASMQRVVPVDSLGFNPIETATPVLDAAQTRLYLGTHDGNIRCMFRGKLSWIFKMNGGVLAAPIVEGETLYVAGGDGIVYALNRFTGAVRWQVDLNEELTTSPTLACGSSIATRPAASPSEEMRGRWSPTARCSRASPTARSSAWAPRTASPGGPGP